MLNLFVDSKGENMNTEELIEQADSFAQSDAAHYRSLNLSQPEIATLAQELGEDRYVDCPGDPTTAGLKSVYETTFRAMARPYPTTEGE